MPDQRNMLDQTKMTAPIPAVGAAGEQSENKKSNDIIPKDRKNNNSLHTLSMTELYDTTYPPKAAIIDGLLYAGTYLFVGAPKIGKSFFMAQLSYHVATGTSLWQYDVHPGEVLLLLTDGILERRDKKSEFFGDERVRSVVREHQSQPATVILERLFDAALAWGDGRPWEDDATIVVLKRAS